MSYSADMMIDIATIFGNLYLETIQLNVETDPMWTVRHNHYSAITDCDMISMPEMPIMCLSMNRLSRDFRGNAKKRDLLPLNKSARCLNSVHFIVVMVCLNKIN